MPSSYRFVVTGRVQGVGFRYAAQGKALFLGLCGWVRNRSDGAVEGAVSGAGPELQQFRDWLAHGPPAAAVGRVEWSASSDETGEGFLVLR
ncbi:MAG: acylphosphatase [Nevskia sp.]|nr:acylphosphatase [Nevskia sp.]